jgi:nucleotidyltransferase substrate binding protein (TIGR01987 family)
MPNDSEIVLLKKVNLLLGDLHRAAMRLGEALGQPENEFVRDAAIQRFEFCFELAWKSIHAAARLEGQDCASPRAAFSTAWRNGWIADEAAWLDMLEERNKTSHTYREAMAKEVLGNPPRHLPHLNQLHAALVTRIREIEAQTREPPSKS